VKEMVEAGQARLEGALGTAANQGQLGVVGYLIGKGMDPNDPEQGGDGLTALHWACMNAHFDDVVASAKFLIACGADPGAVAPETGFGGHQTKGTTPLYWAVQARSLVLVKLLVELGVDLDAKDSKGDTCLTSAEKNCLLKFPFNDDRDAPIAEYLKSVSEEKAAKLEAETTKTTKTTKTPAELEAEILAREPFSMTKEELDDLSCGLMQARTAELDDDTVSAEDFKKVHSLMEHSKAPLPTSKEMLEAMMVQIKGMSKEQLEMGVQTMKAALES